MSPEPSPAPRTIDTLPEAADDYTLLYRGDNGLLARCRIRTYHGADGEVIVATELDENPGPSVTNSAEIVHPKAWRNAGSPERVTFVEHYPGRPVRDGREPRVTDAEQTDLVRFPRDPLGDLLVHEEPAGLDLSEVRFGPASWRHLTREQFAELVQSEQ